MGTESLAEEIAKRGHALSRGVVPDGKPAQYRYCSYHPMSGETVAALGAELDGYQTSKGTVRFAPSDGLPDRLVRKLVEARIAEARR